MAKSCILADSPSFVPSLVVIGGDGKLVQSPAKADLTVGVMNGKQTQSRQHPVAVRPAALQLRMQLRMQCALD